MKIFYILFIFIILQIVPRGTMAQTATNKIQNMATMMLTNSTLFVGGTNMVINGTKYDSAIILKIYGRDGIIRLVPSTTFHSHNAIVWYTNANELTAGWTLGSDVQSNNGHTIGIENLIDGTIPFEIFSNAFISVRIPLVVVSSNMIITNNLTVLGSIFNGSNQVSSVSVTNVMADFPLIAAAASSDISYPFFGTITNMIVTLGRPASEDSSLAVDGSIPSNGFVRLRARNVGAIATDQPNLPYRIQVTKNPIQ